MSSKKSEEVIGKLDKVTDTLESAASQLTGVVSQQQLDLVRERVISCESEINLYKNVYGILSERMAAHATESSDDFIDVKSVLDDVERDYSGLRALVLSAFVLSTVSIIVSILCIAYL